MVIKGGGIGLRVDGCRRVVSSSFEIDLLLYRTLGYSDNFIVGVTDVSPTVSAPTL